MAALLHDNTKCDQYEDSRLSLPSLKVFVILFLNPLLRFGPNFRSYLFVLHHIFISKSTEKNSMAI